MNKLVLDVALGKVAMGAPREPHESTAALLGQLGAKPGEEKKDEKKAEQ